MTDPAALETERLYSRRMTVLFLTGMWEVFALAGLRSVLIYYLVKQLGYSDASAVQIYSYAASGGLLLGLIGGVVADRVLGLKVSVLGGASLMGIGSLALVNPDFLIVGLTLLALGTGLFNPAVNAQVGLIYPDDDPRRTSAFLTFKVGCNIGAVVAPLVFGVVGVAYGWNWCFLISAIGMAIAIATFLYGRGWLPEDEPRSSLKPVARAPFSEATSLVILGAATIGCVLFWTAYKQIETTIALWADSELDRNFNMFGTVLTMPAAWVQAINPIMVFAFAPVLTWFWARTIRQAGTGEDLARMMFGCVMLASGFFIVALSGLLSGGEQVSLFWLIAALVPLTLGELYFQPAGQALFLRLAIRRMTALYLSLFNLTAFAAYMLTAGTGELWSEVSSSTYFLGVSAIALFALPFLVAARSVAKGTTTE